MGYRGYGGMEHGGVWRSGEVQRGTEQRDLEECEGMGYRGVKRGAEGSGQLWRVAEG